MKRGIITAEAESLKGTGKARQKRTDGGLGRGWVHAGQSAEKTFRGQWQKVMEVGGTGGLRGFKIDLIGSDFFLKIFR